MSSRFDRIPTCDTRTPYDSSIIIIIIIIIIHEYYYGGAVALLLQNHLTMSVTEQSQYLSATVQREHEQ